MKIESTIYLDRPEGEIQVTVTGSYYRGSNEYDDPSEINNVRGRDNKGNIVELSEEELEQAEEALAATLD